MIPKVIHYCWFGGRPLPKTAEKCIDSWKKHLPDYEIIRWDESNFDINTISYTSEAYSAGKFAFVSDYARFWIIYNYGGLYFDTDVELIQPLNDIVDKGAFLGVEYRDETMISVNPGLGFGAPAKASVLMDLMTLYQSRHFVNEQENLSQNNIVKITTQYLLKKGLLCTGRIQNCCGFTVYPTEYFCPIDYATRELILTDNTRTIHHYAESWVSRSTKTKNAVGRIVGKEGMALLIRIKKLLKSIIK